MTTQEVAEKLGVNTATVEMYCRAGVAGVQRNDRRWFLDRKDMRAIEKYRKTVRRGRPRKENTA